MHKDDIAITIYVGNFVLNTTGITVVNSDHDIFFKSDMHQVENLNTEKKKGKKKKKFLRVKLNFRKIRSYIYSVRA